MLTARAATAAILALRRVGLARRWTLFVGVLVLAVVGALPAAAATRRASLGDNRWAALDDRSLIWIEALPRRGEGLNALARRLCGAEAAAKEIARLNGRSKLLAGVRTKVPLNLVTGELQVKALRALFAKDRPEPGAWVHQVVGVGSSRREALARVADWFTGSAASESVLRSANDLATGEPRAGQTVRIPMELLRPALRAVVPPAAAATRVTTPTNSTPPVSISAKPASAAPAQPVMSAAPKPAVVEATMASGGDEAAGEGATVMPALDDDEPAAPTEPSRLAAPAATVEPLPSPAAVRPATISATPSTWRLEYGRDSEGDYALYRLKPGEALYSSVVVRFTGRIHAEDVSSLAVEIARRSRIADVTNIPVGFAVRIPFDVLQPEFLPLDHPRRRAYEADLAASEQFANPVTAAGLAGVTVILDAGHGGRDTGASFAGVWESLYAYDIVLRIKQSLETRTAARVRTTTVDDAGYVIPDRDVLPFSRTHRVLTTPPYPIEDAKAGVHLRWYLANSVLRSAVKAKTDADKVVFISVHADSLHPSLRGAMIYIPGAEGRAGTFGKTGSIFAARHEVAEQPTVRFAAPELIESEGLSRDLARHLIDGLRRQALAIHPFKPVRESVIRNRREWVPAVLRYNAVPAKLLLEVCNLANDEDRRLIQTRAFRQQIADSVVQGLLGYYGYAADLTRPQLVAAASGAK